MSRLLTERKMAHQAYIDSPQWKAVRERIFALRGRKCEHCPSTLMLDVHHLTYERLGAELDEDLQILCEVCHAGEHHQSIEIRPARLKPKHSSSIIYCRVPVGHVQAIDEAAKRLGQDRSTFIRQAIQERLHRDLHRNQETETVVASLNNTGKEIRGLRAVAKMLFALQRETANLLLLRTREPQGEALADALSRLPQQQKKLLAAVVAEYQGGDITRLIDRDGEVPKAFAAGGD